MILDRDTSDHWAVVRVRDIIRIIEDDGGYMFGPEVVIDSFIIPSNPVQ